MRRRPQRLMIACVAGVFALAGIAGCEARVYGAPPPPALSHLVVVAPEGTVAPVPDATLDEPPATFKGLDDRTRSATAAAARSGADITVLILDRETNQLISNGNTTTIAIASVAKLFIADDLLLQEAKGQTELSAADRKALDVMLRSSDDNAAETFWNRSGGNAIITRVSARYGLKSTAPPSNGRWWNTISTAADLVRYYDMLLDGSGGLPPERASIILSNLAQSTPMGIDGYPQRFGIPDGISGEPVAVKQGWMCCVGADWMHLSTGVIGPDRRYVMVIGSMQPADDDTARATITNAVKAMFPRGRI